MYQLDLNALVGGGLAEKFAIEMQKVADNIADPNTKAEAVRSVTITIKFKPDEEREIAISDVNVTSKLAPSKGISTKFIIGTNGKGGAEIAELVSGVKGQMMFDMNSGKIADDKGRAISQENDTVGDSSKVVNFR